MKVTGQAGRVLEVWGDLDRTYVSTLCKRSGFSRHQVRVAMGRLKRLGLVTREAADVWRRVEAKVPIAVGDRVRFTGEHALRIHVGVVDHIIGDGSGLTSVAVRSEVPNNGLRDGCFRVNLASLERLPDEQPTPPPAPRPSGYVPQRKPDVPDYKKTPFWLRGVV